MIDAELNRDQELYDRLAKHREARFNTLLRIQADLVYYGHFTLQDTEKMKVLERRFHINEINRRIEEMNKSRAQSSSNLASKSRGKRRKH